LGNVMRILMTANEAKCRPDYQPFLRVRDAALLPLPMVRLFSKYIGGICKTQGTH